MKFKVWARIDKGSRLLPSDWEDIAATFRQHSDYEFGTDTGDAFGVALGLVESPTPPHEIGYKIGEKLLALLGKNADIRIDIEDNNGSGKSLHFGVMRSTFVDTAKECPDQYN
jgi:hypothetical protein